MQISNKSTQFETPFFVIVGNCGEYTPYRYVPFTISKSQSARLSEILAEKKTNIWNNQM